MQDKPRAFTSSLEHLIKRDLQNAPDKADEILDWYDKKIEFFSKALAPITEPLPRAHFLHQAIDKSLAAAAEKDAENFSKITCRKGCAHCCHTVIAITQDEAELLIEYAKHINWKIDWEKVEKQAWHATNRGKYFKLLPENNACVFLGENNICQVYEHRPSSCRKYFVINDPIDCSPQTKVPNGAVNNWTIQHVELLLSGAFEMDHARNGTMQEMLLKAKREMPQ